MHSRGEIKHLRRRNEKDRVQRRRMQLLQKITKLSPILHTFSLYPMLTSEKHTISRFREAIDRSRGEPAYS